MCSRSSYVSLTDPACEFSSGTTPNAASPLVTRENTSLTVSHGNGSASGNSDPHRALAVRAGLSLIGHLHGGRG